MQRAERVKERAAESKQLLVEAVRKSELGGDETKAVDFEVHAKHIEARP